MMTTTHVHDIAQGSPGARIPVELDFFISGHGWREVGRGVTNEQGFIHDFGEPPAQGIYRLMFDVASYNPRSFFPSIAATFEVRDPQEHFHIALLLSPFGYSIHLGA
ncbi:MAG: hydroxyisourate hydrolase [Acidobacteriia bacterium]|nr:hydroxyisourate hydrolase [Terriglobia bacterium]